MFISEETLQHLYQSLGNTDGHKYISPYIDIILISSCYFSREIMVFYLLASVGFKCLPNI